VKLVSDSSNCAAELQEFSKTRKAYCGHSTPYAADETVCVLHDWVLINRERDRWYCNSLNDMKFCHNWRNMTFRSKLQLESWDATTLRVRTKVSCKKKSALKAFSSTWSYIQVGQFSTILKSKLTSSYIQDHFIDKNIRYLIYNNHTD